MLKALCMQNKLLNSYKGCQCVKISPYLIFTPKDSLVDFAPLCLPLRRANPPTNLQNGGERKKKQLSALTLF